MNSKREAINVLITTEINDGLIALGEELGISKSRAVRFICMDYLTKQNLITIHEANTFQHL
jgi:hypothetical protein